ncbi:MAG: 16S rRNA (guanine(966)-N(2))-methyltransferase RsmD [Woeseiaceae bacterium]
MASSSKNGSIRIIGGDWRGRRLPVAVVPGLRPTGDRVRETLFNWLQGDIHGMRVLDLFAGTGALGFEALSRGAKHAVLVENNRAAATILSENIAKLNAQAEVVCTDSRRLIAKPPAGEPFDLLLVDPPFSDRDAADMIESATKSGWLTAGGLVYWEQPAAGKKFDAPTLSDRFERVREKSTGRVQFGLYRFSATEGDA